MKVRLDFVTNSSSSSYVCEVCGESYGGWDVCLADAEMQECVKGHVVCTCHVEISEEDEEILEEYPNDVPSQCCPICTLKHVRDSDMLDYVLKMAGSLFPPTKERIAEEIRKGNCNLEELRRWCDEG